MARTSDRILLLASVALLLPRLGRADGAAEARLRDALRSATAQVRTLEDEVATSKSKEAALQKEIEALRAQSRVPPPSPRHSDREVAELRRQLAEQSEANRQLIDASVKCAAASRERAEASRACEEERAKLAPQVSSCAEQLAKAGEKNERMFRVGKDIIDWLSKVGVGAAIAAREPFLGVKRVELENAAQDWEDALHAQRLRPAGAPVSSAAGAP
jgi:chromosome segregation ATPase